MSPTTEEYLERFQRLRLSASKRIGVVTLPDNEEYYNGYRAGYVQALEDVVSIFE